MGDSRGHQGTVESLSPTEIISQDGNGTVDFVPEDSQNDKILLLGARSDMTKYIDYQFRITPGKRGCMCVPFLSSNHKVNLNCLVAKGVFI